LSIVFGVDAGPSLCVSTRRVQGADRGVRCPGATRQRNVIDRSEVSKHDIE
jgi:hypothetical protein